MNNFILIQTKEKAIDISFQKQIDIWYLINKDQKPEAIQIDNEKYSLSKNILLGLESQSSIIDFKNEKISLIIGDFYKMYPDDSKSIIEYINTDTKDEVYHKIGGAFSWMNILLKEGKLEIYTDMFGQLPLFYYHDDNIFAISTSIDLLINTITSIPRNADMERVIEFIVSKEISNYYLTFFKYIYRLKGNKKLIFDTSKNSLDISPLYLFG